MKNIRNVVTVLAASLSFASLLSSTPALAEQNTAADAAAASQAVHKAPQPTAAAQPKKRSSRATDKEIRNGLDPVTLGQEPGRYPTPPLLKGEYFPTGSDWTNQVK